MSLRESKRVLVVIMAMLIFSSMSVFSVFGATLDYSEDVFHQEMALLKEILYDLSNEAFMEAGQHIFSATDEYGNTVTVELKAIPVKDFSARLATVQHTLNWHNLTPGTWDVIARFHGSSWGSIETTQRIFVERHWQLPHLRHFTLTGFWHVAIPPWGSSISSSWDFATSRQGLSTETITTITYSGMFSSTTYRVTMDVTCFGNQGVRARGFLDRLN